MALLLSVESDSTDDLRQQLLSLDSNPRDLRAEKAQLEAELAAYQTKFDADINAIRVKMDEVDQGLSAEQRVARQLAFGPGIINNDNIIEGLARQMSHDTGLKIALFAIANGRGTVQYKNKFASAILTEMAGETSELFQAVATRVLELQGNNGDEQPFSTPDLTSTSAAFADDLVATDAYGNPLPQNVAPLMPLVSYGSPSVKSEVDSTMDSFDNQANMRALQEYEANAAHLTPSPQPGIPNKTTAAMYRAPLQSDGDASGPLTPFPNFPAPKVQAPAISQLGNKFPGLLESIALGTAKKRALPDPEPEDTPEPAQNGAARQGTPSRVKRNKTGKEPVMSGTYIAFLKHIEVLHQKRKGIANLLKCSKCQNNRRDVRILRCLHIYCHKCILTLRAAAEKGDAQTGFNSACVVAGCPEVVTGKTSVLDADLIDFLLWYDAQDAGIQHGPAQLQVMKLALEKTPNDEDVKAKDYTIKREIDNARLRGVVHSPCDLVKIASLVRKPY
ncbi:hypothetical protein LTR10_017411 [Elasticomyces elasticus]|uniref:RING-type domain-containing protein n=1 Tax=Exophiala sideris TaxID=1016849 RepID=A0ABR0JB30_9EURO|nr:hypothetical protein LTR10_017411 [Elasticomyces elasticus]KAK5027833.1 hypothetical protein LTS07_006708 [Exophiala sideris]KAK5037578.1 hypothetical protein LTR13_004736 [Exophiala sideris]KAK5059239.1 hypothetical protein LTR69_006529 [Exophiala sideris]KAK5183073.1 hypothetical protein LTR44_004784 [Eurotiomycetes sp. CCFEE 6388]